MILDKLVKLLQVSNKKKINIDEILPFRKFISMMTCKTSIWIKIEVKYDKL